MKISRIAPRLAVAVAALALALVTGGTPAPAAPGTGTPSTWTLHNVDYPICAQVNDPRVLYYFVILEGTWYVPISLHYTDMPDGVEPYSPIMVGPGSGDGHVVQTFAAFRVGDTEPGRYIARLWATDGVVTQSVPVTLDVKVRC